ncbi:MAG TPA: MHYT domain-containing protein [Gemmatimonadales bacterium]|nr:MHYT domain-containing protein [Gemmatimonadales bacterium]
MSFASQIGTATPLPGRYSIVLVFLAVGVAVLSSFTALALAGRVSTTSGRLRLAWLAGGGLALGIGMWAMHFVGMLSFRIPIPMGYRGDYLFLALVVAIASAALALYVVSRSSFSTVRLLVGGALVGASFVVMHVLGMQALHTQATVTYRSGLLLASVFIAVGVSLAALGLAWRSVDGGSAQDRRRRIAAALGVGGAMAGMHYTALAAAQFHPDPGLLAPAPAVLLATEGLAAAVVVATVSVVGLALAGALGDRYLQAQSAQLEQARASERALRETEERQRHALALLQRSEQRHRALVTATSSIVWIADPDGAFIEPQPLWEAYTGQSWEQYQGSGWAGALHPEDRERVPSEWERARTNLCVYQSKARVWCARANGYHHTVLRAVPTLGPGGQVLEWTGTVSDVEEQWEAEERLRQVDRMEAVGQLAGGIAHEANNQMSVILGCASFVLRRPELDPAVRQDVEHMRQAAARTATITAQLLAFSRRQLLQPKVLQLNDLVRGLEPILRRTLGESGELLLDLDPALGPIKADPGQLEQVLLNLTFNARDAMPGGGRLVIETRPVELTAAHGAAHPDVRIDPGPYVFLAVSDTGHGMDETTRARIFEPFFTTKAVGEGTGLGLSTVYGIVKQSGGYVWAYSEPGVGSTFKVYLPVVANERPAKAPPATKAPPAVAGETALVVEDDPMVRIMAARALVDHGYAVLEAERATAALELLAGRATRVDVVITDVAMPGLGGRELAARVAELRPGTAVLFMSGYSDEDVVRRGLLEENQPFLQKPFTPELLARQLHDLLHGNGKGGAPT